MTSYIAGWLRAALPQLPEEGVQAVTSYLTSQQKLYQLASGIGLKDIILSEVILFFHFHMLRALNDITFQAFHKTFSLSVLLQDLEVFGKCLAFPTMHYNI